MKAWRIFVIPVITLSFAGHLAAQEGRPLKVLLRLPAGIFVTEGVNGPEGFDVDLLNRFGVWYQRQTGREIEFEATVVSNIAELLESVRQGQCDLALGSITATGQREAIVDFSQPYLPVRMVAFGVSGRIEAGPYQERLAGRRVGGLVSSTGALRVERLASEVEGLVPRTGYQTYDSMFRALVAEDPEIDAVVTDVTHFWVLDRRTQALVMVAPVGPEQGLAFVLPEGSPLKETVDGFIADFVGSASYYSLVQRYFGTGAAEMVRMARDAP